MRRRDVIRLLMILSVVVDTAIVVAPTTAATTTEATTPAPETTTDVTEPPGTTTTTLEPTITTSARPDPLPASGAYLPLDDAHVQQAQSGVNFGALASMRSDRTPMSRALLAFEVPDMSGPVTGAVLRLYLTGGTTNGPEVWSSGPFEEETVTWDSSPALDTRIVDLGSVSRDRWLEIDVKSAVTGEGTYGFALVPDSTNGISVNSREASSNQPQLVVETGDPPPPPPPPPSGDSFQIGLIGDTGYSSSQEDALFDTRKDMNGRSLAFAAHAGDIWGGSSSCSESRYKKVRDVFNGFEAPVVYTPGDNEWKDCSGGSSGKLSMIRKIFFSSDETLGQDPMRVTRQETYVENARWTVEGVVFATINEPGSSGASGSHRDANVDWLKETFEKAEDTDAAGVMFIWQDNSFRPSGGALYRELKKRTIAFERPVVLVHGDTHQYQVDHPWSDVDNFTRVEVYGTDDRGRWVRGRVDPDDRDVFSFSSETP